MSLDEMLPDDADSSSSDSGSTSFTETKQDIHKEFHSNVGTKKFTEEKWEEMKKVIRRETEYTVNEVENMKAEDRHKVLHDVAQIAAGNMLANKAGISSNKRCGVCGDDCSDSYVLIDDTAVHIHHTVAMVAEELELKLRGKINENRS